MGMGRGEVAGGDSEWLHNPLVKRVDIKFFFEFNDHSGHM